MNDLVVLAADKDMEFALRGLLSRHPRALQIRDGLTWKVFTHPHHDPGCRTEAVPFLRLHRSDFQHALVMFDFEGCGAEHQETPESVEASTRDQLRGSGWGDRAECVVIAPELETWVWSDSPEVEHCLGWQDPRRVRDWLQAEALWEPDQPKPTTQSGP